MPAALSAVADGVWTDAAPVRIVGMELTSAMTVLRLRDGGLLVHSPIALTPERRAAVEALGPVKHLYSPNLFHHLSLGHWSAAFPGARVHAPGGLARKRPDLRIDRAHDLVSEPDFAGFVDEVVLEGFRLGETVVFHRPSRTLVVADLVANVGRPAQAWARVYTRAMGFYDRVALSRILRWTAVADRAALRKSVDAVLALPFERVVVGHGEPLVANAKAALAAGCAWLR
jgi:hypothetical protein